VVLAFRMPIPNSENTSRRASLEAPAARELRENTIQLNSGGGKRPPYARRTRSFMLKAV
jgi:hypothetical protein